MHKPLIVGLLSLLLLAAGCSSTSTKSDEAMSMSKDASMVKDGVFMKDGKILETMDGKTTDLMMDVTLKDGTKIMTDGTVIMKDGSKAMLMEGDMYDLEGMKSSLNGGM